jgi:hypothetical protein
MSNPVGFDLSCDGGSNLFFLSIKVLAIDSKNNHAYQAAGEGSQEVSARRYMPEEGTA